MLAFLFFFVSTPPPPSLPVFLFLPHLLTSRSAERGTRNQWLTASVDINCAFARCFGTGERLLGDLVADVNQWDSTWPCSLACLCVSVSLFLLRLPFYPWPPFTTSVSHSPQWFVSVRLDFPPTQRRWAVERCINQLTEAHGYCLTRNSKDNAPLDTCCHLSHFKLASGD